MSIKDWKKLGYSYEQSEELERLSRIGDDMGDIDAHVADKILQETMRKYELEKENNNMNSATSLAGKSLFDTLKEQSEKFNRWINESEEFLSGISTENMDKEVPEEIFGKKNANLGRSLNEQLTEEYEKFAKWTSESQIILNLLKNVKETANELKELDDAPVELLKGTDDAVTVNENDKYTFVDSFEIDLRNNTYFDVSQWEGSVKPVKAILSICMPKETTYNVVNDITDNWNKLGKSNNFDVNLTIGNMIFLMEDGTFKSVD